MTSRWQIAEQVSEEAFDPGVQIALGALGYQVVAGASTAQEIDADLWIVDEEKIDRVPRATAGTLQRIVVLTREPGGASSDPRAVASLPRPVTLRAIYAVLQSVLENTPRRAPRVSTDLAARCWHGNRFWTGSVLSLSETGCLFRSLPESPPEREVTLVFALPSDESISTWASPVGIRGQDVALSFGSVRPDSRLAISQHVVSRLTGKPAGLPPAPQDPAARGSG